MLPGRRQDNGSIFITETVPPDPVFEGGIVVGRLGAIHVTSTLPPQVAVNGFMARHSGELCVAYGGPIAFFEMGLPFTADGRLVCQLNQAVAPSDPYVGGVRVGPLGGVYTIDLTPPPEINAFSDGFDGGFQ